MNESTMSLSTSTVAPAELPYLRKMQIPETKPLLIGLDRDGTLVPYASKPDQALMSSYVSWVLRELAKLPGVTVCLVSARPISQLTRDVGASEVILAGNYGLEVRYPGGTSHVNPMALRAVPELKRIKEALTTICQQFPDLILEDHGYSLNLSYLNVAPDQVVAVRELVLPLQTSLRTLVMNAQATNYEFFPAVNWSKACALAKIESALNLKAHEYFPIFVGDTEGDEPAFAWVNERGGLSIRVAGANVITQAKQRFDSPDEATSFLEEIRRAKTVTPTSS